MPLKSSPRPPVVCRLRHHNTLVVGVPRKRKIVLEIVQAALPPRIKGLPEHVVRHMILRQVVEERLGRRLVPSLVDVNHDRGPLAPAAPLVDAMNSGKQQVGEVLPIRGQTPVRPHHAGGHLVAHLHHVGQHMLLAHRGNGVARVGESRLHQFRMRHLSPAAGHRLVAGIRPVVGDSGSPAAV